MKQTAEADHVLLNPGVLLLGHGLHGLEVGELGEAGGDEEDGVGGHAAVAVAQGVKEHQGLCYLQQNLRGLSQTRSVALENC